MIIRTNDNILINTDNVSHIFILNCANGEFIIKAVTTNNERIEIKKCNSKEECIEKFNELSAKLNVKEII